MQYKVEGILNVSMSFRSSELWCGQARGRVSVWNLHTTSMKVVSHPDVTSDNTTVVHLVTDPTTMKNSAAIWSYVYPGKCDCSTQFIALCIEIQVNTSTNDLSISQLLP